MRPGAQPPSDLKTATAQNRGSAGTPAGPPPPKVPPGTGGYKSPDDLFEARHKREFRKDPGQGGLSAWLQDKGRTLRYAFQTTPQLKGKDLFTTDGRVRSDYFAPAIDRIRQFHGLMREKRFQAKAIVGDVLGKDTRPQEYELWVRWLDNLDRQEDLQRDIKVGDGFTLENVGQELSRIESNVTPRVQQMMERYLRMNSAMWDEFVKRGLVTGENRRTYQMPHEILDAPVFQQPGATKFREQVAKSQKKRGGTGRDRNLNLVDVLHRRWTDNLARLEEFDIIQGIAERYDLKRPQNQGKLFDDAGKPLQLKPGDQIPVGYVVRDLRQGFFGKRFGSVADRTIEELANDKNLDRLAKHYGVSASEFRFWMTQHNAAGPVQGFADELGSTKVPKGDDYVVIPVELDEAINQAFGDAAVRKMRAAELQEKATNLIKSGYLNLNPVRYNKNNAVGNLELGVAQFGNDFFGEHWTQAWKSTVDFYQNGTIDPSIQQALSYGVSGAGRTAGDVAQTLSDPRLFNLQFPAHAKTGQEARVWARRLASYVPRAGAFVDDVFRVSVMKMNNDRMRRGLQPLLGRADPAIVQGLLKEGGQDANDRVAAYIAREAFGDYGRTTLFEDRLRGLWAPFYMWAKTNTTFWPSIVKMASSAETRKGAFAASASRAARGLAMVTSAVASVRVMNEMLMGEEEEQLPSNARQGTHMVIPDLAHYQKTGEWQGLRDKNGKLVTFGTRDALDDFFTVLGMDRLVPETFDMLRKTLPPEEFARRQIERIAKGPIRYAGNQIGPIVQLPLAMAGVRTFPDVLNPYQVQPEQRMSLLADAVSLGTVGSGANEALTSVVPGAQDQLFQPRPNPFSPEGLTQSLGLKSYASPSILQDVGKTPYEAELIRKIEQTEADIRGLEGRMAREIGRESNRQLTPEQRRSRFRERLDIIKGSRLQELRGYYERLKNIQRYRRQNGSRND